MMFKRYRFDDKLDGNTIRTVAYVGFPKVETELGWKVQALIFTRTVGEQQGSFRYVELHPDKEIAGKAITNLAVSGADNWVNALVYTDALDTWLKPFITEDEDTGTIHAGKALGLMTIKKRQIGVRTEED